MEILSGGLDRVEVVAFLQHHLKMMAQHSPAESIHALDMDELKHEDVSFFSMWNNDQLMGCAALKELDSRNGEVKSMRTVDTFLRQGVAQAMLDHIVGLAGQREYSALWLETGSMEAFWPARQMYLKYGFAECVPFSDYSPDPNSVFMTLKLG